MFFTVKMTNIRQTTSWLYSDEYHMQLYIFLQTTVEPNKKEHHHFTLHLWSHILSSIYHWSVPKQPHFNHTFLTNLIMPLSWSSNTWMNLDFHDENVVWQVMPQDEITPQPPGGTWTNLVVSPGHLDDPGISLYNLMSTLFLNMTCFHKALVEIPRWRNLIPL